MSAAATHPAGPADPALLAARCLPVAKIDHVRHASQIEPLLEAVDAASWLLALKTSRSWASIPSNSPPASLVVHECDPAMGAKPTRAGQITGKNE